MSKHLPTARSVLPGLLFAAVTAAIGAFIGNRVEPTWRALVDGEGYRIRGNLARQEVTPDWFIDAALSPPRPRPADPAWAGGGAVLGFGLGVVGRRWRFRGRGVALLLGSLLGMAVCGAYAVASVKPEREGRGVSAEQVNRALTEGLLLGGAIGFVSVWWVYPSAPKRRPDSTPERSGVVPAA